MNDPLPTGLDPRGTAFFLDCDGTLAEIVAHPAMARVEPRVRDGLARLHVLTGGAVAVVSGRSIAQLDALLAPLRLPAAGVHGAERRDADGRLHRAEADAELIGDVARRVAAFTGRLPGLVCETKPASVALHYRMRPELERTALDFAAGIVAGHAALYSRPGKMVIEISASSRTKGDAIAAFMAEPPFAGRLPVFAGDDVTDEDGFAAVAAMAGVTIKIGAEPTSAAWRVAHMRDLHRWLDELAERWRLAGREAGLPAAAPERTVAATGGGERPGI